MQEPGASDAFAGVAFHCYIGQVSQQDTFHNNFPNKELYFTECSGTLGSDFWTDLQVRSHYTTIPVIPVTLTLIFPHKVVHEQSVSFPFSCFCSFTDETLNRLSRFIVGLQHWAQSGLMWNFAANPQGGPKLSGATSCGTGCRGVVTISGSDYQLNQECKHRRSRN